MACIKVAGIPNNVKMGKLVPLFRKLVSLKASDYYMVMLPSIGPTKDMTITFASHVDVRSILQRLDNFVFRYNGNEYPFTVTRNYGYNQNFELQDLQQNEDVYTNEEFDLGRHHSPNYSEEVSNLDLQIDLLRKQRMVLEEERKLLEEQKKLEDLKREAFINQGPSAFHILDVNQGPELSSVPTTETKRRGVFMFHQATGVLLRKMNVFIEQHSLPEERKALVSLLRSTLKQRCEAVVEADGQGVFRTYKVIKLYRSKYPSSEDEELVKQLLNEMRQGSGPADQAAAATAGGANADDASDGTKSVAGDNSTLKEEKATAEDTTQSGEKKFIKTDTKDSKNTNNETESNDSKHRSNERRRYPCAFDEKRLSFHKASVVLLKKLYVYMNMHSKFENRRQLAAILRNTLKKRLAAVLDGKPIYHTHKVIKLYRSTYPSREDEDLVKEVIKDINEGRLPDDITGEAFAYDDYLPDGMTEELFSHGSPKYTKPNSGEGEDNKKYIAEEGATGSGPPAEIKESVNILDNVAADSNTGDDSKMQVKTESVKTDQNCADSINIDGDNIVIEENRGVKRKTEEVEDNGVKIAKTFDDVGDTEDNDLEDWS